MAWSRWFDFRVAQVRKDGLSVWTDNWFDCTLATHSCKTKTTSTLYGSVSFSCPGYLNVDVVEVGIIHVAAVMTEPFRCPQGRGRILGDK